MPTLITQRHFQDPYGQWTDSLECAYVDYYESMGLKLYPVLNTSKQLEDLLAERSWSHIILTGGGDVDESYYKNRMNNGQNNRERTELLILDYAVKNRIPVLGICRGMHSINMYFGGGGSQDMSSIDTDSLHAPRNVYSNLILDDDLSAKVGVCEFRSLSFHKQCIPLDALAPKLQAFSRAVRIPITTGLMHQNLPIVGIQWHPERTRHSKEVNDVLIPAFVQQKIFWKKRELAF